MNERIIPIADHRQSLWHQAPRQDALPALTDDANRLTSGNIGPLFDQRQRPLRDLRISVTDRCNFRCTYCMPKEVFGRDYAFMPQSALLSFEEITHLAKVFITHGVEKIRLTGGEPLLRKNIEALIEMLAVLRLPDGRALDLTLTTNGALMARKAQSLKDAGLNRVTVSLDALDDAIFQRMNDAEFPVADVLAGIEAAQAVGLAPLKVNMVVQKGVNDAQILPMARHFKGSGVTLRFIEYMDVGTTNGWQLDQVVPSAEVIRQINAKYPLVAVNASYAGEVAERWRYRNASGDASSQEDEIGVISSVTQAFCGSCTRARLSTEGKLYTCLFASQGYDLRSLLRAASTSPSNDLAISNAIANIWQGRDDRYSELRSSETLTTANAKVEMSYIGG